VLKLRIAVGVLAAFADVGVGLQAVAQAAQQPRDGLMRDPVAELTQTIGQPAHALGRPAQRKLRIAATVAVNEALEILDERRVAGAQRPPATARAPHAPALERLAGLQLAQPATNGVLRDSRRARHRRDPATPMPTRLSGRPQTPTPLIKLPRHSPIVLTDRDLVDHASTLRRPTPTPSTSYVTIPRDADDLPSGTQEPSAGPPG
jgi:hypothetical protein